MRNLWCRRYECQSQTLNDLHWTSYMNKINQMLSMVTSIFIKPNSAAKWRIMTQRWIVLRKQSYSINHEVYFLCESMEIIFMRIILKFWRFPVISWIFRCSFSRGFPAKILCMFLDIQFLEYNNADFLQRTQNL